MPSCLEDETLASSRHKERTRWGNVSTYGAPLILKCSQSSDSMLSTPRRSGAADGRYGRVIGSLTKQLNSAASWPLLSGGLRILDVSFVDTLDFHSLFLKALTKNSEIFLDHPVFVCSPALIQRIVALVSFKYKPTNWQKWISKEVFRRLYCKPLIPRGHRDIPKQSGKPFKAIRRQKEWP